MQTANRFRSRITASRDGRTMDGKSILGMLLLAASQGTALELRGRGRRRGGRPRRLVALVEGGFGEEA